MTCIARQAALIVIAVATVWIAESSPLMAQAQSLYNRQGPVRGQTNSLIPQTTSGASSLTGGNSGATALGAQQGAAAFGATTNIRRGSFVGMDDGGGSFVGLDPNAVQSGRNANANSPNTRTNRTRNTSRRSANRGQAGGNQNYQQFGRGNQDYGRGNQGSQNRRRAIRPQQRVNFNFPQRDTSEVVSTLRDQFTTFADRYPTLANVTVLEDNGRIELYGEVDSPERRHLAELIAGMEPGIREVVNHLTVQTPPPSLQ